MHYTARHANCGSIVTHNITISTLGLPVFLSTAPQWYTFGPAATALTPIVVPTHTLLAVLHLGPTAPACIGLSTATFAQLSAFHANPATPASML